MLCSGLFRGGRCDPIVDTVKDSDRFCVGFFKSILMNLCKSIRAKLIIAFTLSALPVLLISGSMVVRHPEQFQRIEAALSTTQKNIEQLRQVAAVLRSKRYSQAGERQALSELINRIQSRHIQTALSSDLLLLLEKISQTKKPVNSLDLRTAVSLIEQLLYEEEALLSVLTQELLQTTNRVQTIQAIQISIAVLMVLVLSSLLSKHFSVPLEKLNNTITQIRTGVLGAQTDYQGEDELGLVSRAFNEMSLELERNLISRKYLDSILENIKEGLLVIEANGVIEFANAAIGTLCGKDPVLLIGQDITAVLPEYNLEASAQSSWNILHTAGERIPVAVNAVRIMDTCGVDRFVLTCHDERTRLQLRDEREQFKLKLAHSERLASLGTLSGEVAHRLNQPLTSLRLFLQQSRRKVKNSTTSDSDLLSTLELCLAETGRATEAVQSILQYTRKEPIHKTHCLLQHIVERTQIVFSERLRAQEIQIEICGDTATSLYCSREEIEELLFILINNAIDAMTPGGGIITVEWSLTDSGVLLSVADTGSGIAEDAVDKVFDVFYTTKPAGKGTGLGLSIARKITEDHDALISVTQRTGGGSIFMVQFKHSEHYEGASL